MKISADHLKRYRQIAQLLWKYGRSDLAAQMNTAQGIEPDPLPADPAAAALPEQLADDLEAMGPTYVKLGQVLASRPDLLPEPYLKALCRLQDRVKPFAYVEVEQIITAALGARISKLFSRFDEEPIAAASLGQVHTAALRDGRPVVVKVQRPGIREAIAQDFEVLTEIATFLDEHTAMGKRYRFGILLEEFRISIEQELNYEREAQNLVALGRNMQEFALIHVPQPILDYSTKNVLTMEQVQGRKITSISPLTRLETPGAPLIEELFRAYLKQILVDGVFHADPHPGNVFLTDDSRIALLDLGMVGHTTPSMQENLLKLLLAVSEGKSDEAADLMIRIGQKTTEFNGPEFRRRIVQLLALRHSQQLHQINIGRAMLELTQIAAENGLFVPSELTLLGKTLLQLDEIGKALDPHFDPNEAIRRNVGKLMSQRMLKDATQGSVFGSLLELKGFLTTLPSRLNQIFDVLTNAELEVRVRAVDAKLFVEGLEKVANRITAGIVLAALIIGAALLMRVETTWRLFGYPGLAMLFFLAAGGGWILAGDQHVHQRSPEPEESGALNARHSGASRNPCD
jgi:predicted unusual protein kinase regulating ubiquinone biosynthesis (AarF/ABC1/UbiB family)